MVFSCFAVYVVANNTRVEPYFEPCMALSRVIICIHFTYRYLCIRIYMLILVLGRVHIYIDYSIAIRSAFNAESYSPQKNKHIFPVTPHKVIISDFVIILLLLLLLLLITIL